MQHQDSPRPYSQNSLQKLFDEMSQSYGLVNLVASFGFSWYWRTISVKLADIQKNDRVLDIMSGQGECLALISKRTTQTGFISAIDFSAAMCQRADRNRRRLQKKSNQCCQIEIQTSDVFDLLNSSAYKAAFDAVHCSFGIKTLAPGDYPRLLQILQYALKPGGHFSFIEISCPDSKIIRWPYLFYLKHIVPVIGWLFLGHPENYRRLGYYTANFKNCRALLNEMHSAGFKKLKYHRLFGGCATAISGCLPE